jgi:hypothetical protein
MLKTILDFKPAQMFLLWENEQEILKTTNLIELKLYMNDYSMIPNRVYNFDMDQQSKIATTTGQSLR